MILLKLCNLIKFRKCEKWRVIILFFECILEYDIDYKSMILEKLNVICKNEYIIDEVRNVLIEFFFVNKDVVFILSFVDKF